MFKKITLALALTIGTVSTGYAAGYIFPSSESQNTKIQGGVIRIDPTLGVYLHNNSTHHPIGIVDVHIDTVTGGIYVEKDLSDAVVTVSVTPDETLTEMGIEVGLSGGGRVSQVFFYKDGRKLNLNKPTDYVLVASPVANIWFMTVTHNTVVAKKKPNKVRYI